MTVTRKTTSISFTVSCDEPCSLSAFGNMRTTPRQEARRLPADTPSRPRSRSAGGRPCKLRLSRSTQNDLRRALVEKRGATVFFDVTATDAAGNSIRVQRPDHAPRRQGEGDTTDAAWTLAPRAVSGGMVDACPRSDADRHVVPALRRASARRSARRPGARARPLRGVRRRARGARGRDRARRPRRAASAAAAPASAPRRCSGATRRGPPAARASRPGSRITCCCGPGTARA